MSPAQQDPDSEPASRHAYPRTRYRRQPRAMESEAPLSHLRRRCANSAVAASVGYLAVLTTTAVRPTAMSDPVAIGLLIGTGTVAGLCALGAVLAWAVERMPQPSFDQQAETVEWAIRLGEDLADAYRAAPSGGPRGR